MLSIDDCWSFLESQVKGKDPLPDGASEEAIQEAEALMRVKFPEEFRRFLLRHDGSDHYFIFPYKIGGGGQSFVSVKNCLDTWQHLVRAGAEIEEAGYDSEQIGPVKAFHWSPRWVPFAENGCGDHLFIDLDPADGGTIGQVVDWWHECCQSTYQAPSLRAWLNEVVEEIQKGVYHFHDEM